MKRKMTIGLLVLVLLSLSISSGWVFNRHDSNDEVAQASEPTPTPTANEPTITLTLTQVVETDLRLRYGEGIEVRQGPGKVERQYLTYIVANGQLKAILWVDGLMVELASMELATPAPAGE